MLTGDRRDLVEDVSAPDVSVLYAIQSFIAGTSKLINCRNISYFIVLSPLSCQVKFGLIWVHEPPIAGPVDNEWHVPAPLSEQA